MTLEQVIDKATELSLGKKPKGKFAKKISKNLKKIPYKKFLKIKNKIKKITSAKERKESLTKKPETS